MRCERARFALVRWPDAFDMTLPSCITLDDVADALQRGAVLVAREWDLTEEDTIDPAHSNPRRIADDEEDQA